MKLYNAACQVCRVVLEAGVPHHEYIDKKKENVFLHLRSLIQIRCRNAPPPPKKGNLHTKFEANRFSQS